MNLKAAITFVIADTREQDPDNTQTDAELLAEIREFPTSEIDDWENTLEHFTAELGDAYRMVINASDDEIAAAQT
jgi:hypothetical protein